MKIHPRKLPLKHSTLYFKGVLLTPLLLWSRSIVSGASKVRFFIVERFLGGTSFRLIT